MLVLGAKGAFTFHVKSAELAFDLEDLTPLRARSRLCAVAFSTINRFGTDDADGAPG